MSAENRQILGSVNVSEGVNEVIGRMVPSFNATSGAAVGPYRESRLRRYRHAHRRP